MTMDYLSLENINLKFLKIQYGPAEGDIVLTSVPQRL